MKKSWAIAATAAMVGVALFFFPAPREDADPGFRQPHPAALAGEEVVARWHEKHPFKMRRGVALVLHGLNLKPEKMEPLISLLNRAGIDALNVSLRGHGDNYLPQAERSPSEARLDAFRMVTYPLWSSEVGRAYQKVRERGRQKKVNVFLVGYSLGGLLGCDLLVSNPDVRFDRMVLLAPALNVKIESYLLRALMPFPNLVIDSLSPANYRSNGGTPMAGYKALFEALDHFERHLNPALNVPTLVFIDREDEFISHDAMREMIADRHLDRWKMVTVRREPGMADPYAHHLLIDEATMGKTAWREMGDATLHHLLAAPPGKGGTAPDLISSGATEAKIIGSCPPFLPRHLLYSEGRPSINKLLGRCDTICPPQAPSFIADILPTKTRLVSFFNLDGPDQFFLGKSKKGNVPLPRDHSYFLEFHIEPSLESIFSAISLFRKEAYPQ